MQEYKREKAMAKKRKTAKNSHEESGASKKPQDGPALTAAAIEKGHADGEGSMSQRDELNSRNKNSIDKANADHGLAM